MNTMRNAPQGIIGLIGPKGSGKSLFARLLVEEHGFAERIRFAGTIKRMIGRLIHEATGMTFKEARRYVDGSLKEEEIPGFPVPGVTGRSMMQALGTEWGRSRVGEEIWSSIGLNKAKRLRDEGKLAVIDDTRFRNEVRGIRDSGGRVGRVYRPGYEWGEDSHASEGAVASVVPDYFVVNDGSPRKLRRSARTLLNETLHNQSKQ